MTIVVMITIVSIIAEHTNLLRIRPGGQSLLRERNRADGAGDGNSVTAATAATTARWAMRWSRARFEDALRGGAGPCDGGRRAKAPAGLPSAGGRALGA